MKKFNIIYIKIIGSKNNFIKLYNNFSIDQKIIPSNNLKIYGYNYEIKNFFNDSKQIIREGNQILEEINQEITLDEQHYILDVDLNKEDDKFEISDLKYLLLFNEKKFKNKGVINLIVKNNDDYSRYSSFLVLEQFDSKLNMYISIIDNGNINRVANTTTISKEWALPMYISKENKDVFQFLSEFLIKEKQIRSKDSEREISLDEYYNILENMYHEFDNKSRKFTKDTNTYINNLYQYYYMMTIIILFDNVSNHIIKKYIENILNMPALAIIILSLHINAIKKTHKNIYEFTEQRFEELINVAYDYCECILQVVENMISHSDGGYLILRTNNNSKKLEEKYHIKTNDLKSEWFFDFSLIDSSRKGIIENFHDKYDINYINLNDIFADSSKNEQYNRLINSSNHVVHHYGLRVFVNIVNQAKGNFKVISTNERFVDYKNNQQYWINENTDLKDESTDDKESLISVVTTQTLEEHISGTDYEIVIPVSANNGGMEERNNDYTPCTSINPIFEKIYDIKDVIFESEIYDFFNKKLEKIIGDYKQYEYQEAKEKTIEIASKQLYDILCKKNNNKIIYLILTELGSKTSQRIEVIAKVILKTIILTNNVVNLKYVVYGLSKENVKKFVRQFSLFYKREGGCKYMSNTQLFVVSNDYELEILFAGKNLETVIDYNKIGTLNRGIPSKVLETLISIVGTKVGKEKKSIEEVIPIGFDMLPRIEKNKNSEYYLSFKRKWYYNKLEQILKSDIHDNSLGCCLKDTHIRINNIHLDRFYEAQLLFGNSYWCNIFVYYLIDVILLDEKLDENKNHPLLIVGYETYSEPLLFLLKEKLDKLLFKNINYVVYENEKYVTSSEKSPANIRYLSKFLENCDLEDIENMNIVFLSGISSTLSLMDDCLNRSLEKEVQKVLKERFNVDEGQLKKKYKNIYKKGIIIVQVRDENCENSYQEKFITFDNENEKIKEYNKVSSVKYTHFLNESKCSYLISVPAFWSDPKNCPKCFPEDYTKESILIETNETSTVPMILIQPNKRKEKAYQLVEVSTYDKEFLMDKNNKKYLYYEHIDRGGNHYQYYFKTANLIYDLLYNKNKTLKKWFEDIKKIEQNHNATTNINVIVCPAHFSNETFASAVNKHIFDGKAYIINFDVKKEFRATFETNYANYKMAIDIIKLNSIFGMTINFYYVDDQIITGETFYRTRSLVNSLMNEYCFNAESKVKIHIFKAIIVLINRNSSSSILNYFEKNSVGYKSETSKKKRKVGVLPYYRYLNFYTPSIRSYGDSCPNCNKLYKAENLIKESSLTLTANYWIQKKEKNKLKTLSETKLYEINKIKTLTFTDKNDYLKSIINDLQYKGFRRLKSSEQIWRLLFQYDYEQLKSVIDVRNKIISPIIDEILDSDDNDNEKLENIISFFIVLTRPFISYREIINAASLNYLLNIYNIFIGICDKKEKVYSEYHKIYTFLKENKSLHIKKYDLLRAIIGCLSLMGSNWFLNRERLLDCIRIGNNLEQNAKTEITDNLGEYAHKYIDTVYKESFESYLCLQIKRAFYATRDTKIRMEKFGEIIEKELKKIFEGDKNGQ